MKANISILALALAGALNLAANAQDGKPSGHRPPGGPGGPGGRGPSPLVATLDANHDGVVDAAELANAPAALKALDKDNDGQLTREELHPGGRGPRPGGHGGPGGDEQPPEPPQGGPEGKRPVPPLIAALDANHDGVIDASEIANATAALKALDKNNDGQLTMEELRPAGGRGPGGRGPGGPGGPGGPRGPRGPRGPQGPQDNGGQ